MALRAKFEHGIELHQQGKLADAERIYQDVLRRQPNHFDALHMLGVIAINARHLEQGVDLIRKAIGLNANVAAAHSNLGKALLDLNRPQDALACFDRAIALEPDFAGAHNNRGMALLNLYRPQEALASVDRALGLKRDFPEAWNNLACALIALCSWEEAEKACRKAVTLRSDLPDAWNNLGQALIELDRWGDAAVACRNSVALKPSQFVTWNRLAYALIALCRWTEAEEACRKAIALKSDYPDAWINLSRTLSAQKRLGEATEATRRAASLMPEPRGSSNFDKANLCKIHGAINRLVADAGTNSADFTLKVVQIRALHRLIMDDLLPKPGEYRKKSVVNLTSARVPPNCRDVPPLMEDMCRYVNSNWTRRDPIHLGAFVLWHLLWIHPFDDGNGRTARAICNAILRIKNTSPLIAMNSFIEALIENRTVYVDLVRRIIDAQDTYSQTKNIDQATRHVEQWLLGYWQ
jgi:tetratricopeptide (TPR) repeat protein